MLEPFSRFHDPVSIPRHTRHSRGLALRLPVALLRRAVDVLVVIAVPAVALTAAAACVVWLGQGVVSRHLQWCVVALGN